MTDKDGSNPTPAAEEEFSLFHAISEELTKVPEQKQPFHPEAVSPDMEGMESLNSLPSIALSEAKSGSKWEEEDGVVRSGKKSWLAVLYLIHFLCRISTQTNSYNNLVLLYR